jgi:glycosyltransferase involved in cell wall biosynthesis
VVSLARLDAPRLRSLYAACDVLVVPSIRTRNFREPWGLVINEAMNQRVPVIASDAVGAVAGGLVRDRANGLVVPAADAGALADAITRLAGDRDLRERLGATGAQDVRAFSHDAWAEGFSAAFRTVGVSRARW